MEKEIQDARLRRDRMATELEDLEKEILQMERLQKRVFGGALSSPSNPVARRPRGERWAQVKAAMHGAQAEGMTVPELALKLGETSVKQKEGLKATMFVWYKKGRLVRVSEGRYLLAPEQQEGASNG